MEIEKARVKTKMTSSSPIKESKFFDDYGISDPYHLALNAGKSPDTGHDLTYYISVSEADLLGSEQNINGNIVKIKIVPTHHWSGMSYPEKRVGVRKSTALPLELTVLLRRQAKIEKEGVDPVVKYLQGQFLE